MSVICRHMLKKIGKQSDRVTTIGSACDAKSVQE